MNKFSRNKILALFFLAFLLNTDIYSQNIFLGRSVLKKGISSYVPLDALARSFDSSSDPVGIPLGFNVKYSGRLFSNVYCGANGYAVFGAVNGYFTIYSCRLNVDNSEIQSSISSRTEGLAPNRVCKIQWENQSDTYSADFQLWIFENGNTEIHLGKINIDLPTSRNESVLSIGYANGKSDNFYLGYISGDPPYERLIIEEGQVDRLFANGLNSVPLEGTWYVIGWKSSY